MWWQLRCSSPGCPRKKIKQQLSGALSVFNQIARCVLRKAALITARPLRLAERFLHNLEVVRATQHVLKRAQAVASAVAIEGVNQIAGLLDLDAQLMLRRLVGCCTASDPAQLPHSALEPAPETVVGVRKYCVRNAHKTRASAPQLGCGEGRAYLRIRNPLLAHEQPPI